MLCEVTAVVETNDLSGELRVLQKALSQGPHIGLSFNITPNFTVEVARNMAGNAIMYGELALGALLYQYAADNIGLSDCEDHDAEELQRLLQLSVAVNLRVGEFDFCERVLKRLASLTEGGELIETLQQLTEMYEEQGRYTDALELCEQALRVSPHSGVCHYNMADILFKLNRIPESLSYLEQALRTEEADELLEFMETQPDLREFVAHDSVQEIMKEARSR
jgi:tetratricopeptide (TPR) repeat protein